MEKCFTELPYTLVFALPLLFSVPIGDALLDDHLSTAHTPVTSVLSCWHKGTAIILRLQLKDLDLLKHSYNTVLFTLLD